MSYNAVHGNVDLSSFLAQRQGVSATTANTTKQLQSQNQPPSGSLHEQMNAMERDIVSMQHPHHPNPTGEDRGFYTAGPLQTFAEVYAVHGDSANGSSSPLPPDSTNTGYASHKYNNNSNNNNNNNNNNRDERSHLFARLAAEANRDSEVHCLSVAELFQLDTRLRLSRLDQFYHHPPNAPSSSPLLSSDGSGGDAAARGALHAATTATDALAIVAGTESSESLAREKSKLMEEEQLWSLLRLVLEDSDRKGSQEYKAAHIPIRDVAPHRRWFISHYAYIQSFLMELDFFRHMNVIVRWLEATYRQGQSYGDLVLLQRRQQQQQQQGAAQPQSPSSHEDTGAAPDGPQKKMRLRGEEETMLRQLILHRIRCGELHEAIKDAVVYESCPYSCQLSAAQLLTVEEPWCAATALVPLFGEYANGQVQQAWSGNDFRLDALGQFFETSSTPSSASARPSTKDVDVVIAAALCGHAEVLEEAYGTYGSWADVAWCYLRSCLVVSFTKLLLAAQVEVPAAYAAYVTRTVGSAEDWATSYAATVRAGLVQRLQPYLAARSSANAREQLLVRVVLQVLAPEGAWLAVRPDERSEESVRLVTHVQWLLDAAHREALLPVGVQLAAGADMAAGAAAYARRLVQLPHYPLLRGMRAMAGMARRLRDPRHRAQVYAAFLLAARDYERLRGVRDRAAVEEQEAQLVRVFLAVDDDAMAVGAAVQALLNTTVAPAERLTHHSEAERILWSAMHARDEAGYLDVLAQGRRACVAFWLQKPPELGAIQDVSGVLTQRVLPPLVDTAVPAAAVTEVQFWYTLCELRRGAEAHGQLCRELSAALAAADDTHAPGRTHRRQLAQEEAKLLSALAQLATTAAWKGGAVVHQDSRCVSAVLQAVRYYVEEVGLALAQRPIVAAAAAAEPTTTAGSAEDLSLLQSVLQLIAELDRAGYFEQGRAPRAEAAALLSRVQGARVNYGRRLHRRQMAAVLQEQQKQASD